MTGHEFCWVLECPEQLGSLVRAPFAFAFYSPTELCRVHYSYWELAIPIMIVLIPLVMYRDVKNFVRYLMRREDSRRAVNQVR